VNNERRIELRTLDSSHEPAFVHDQYPMRQREQFGQVRGD
jgi:hypothetical protein